MDLHTSTLTENKVKLLCSAANTFTTAPLSNILKSYYLTKCRMLTLSGNVSLPQRFSKSTIRCPRCCVQYEDGPVTAKIQPHKKSKFARKLIKKNENGKRLTRYQNKYLKNLTRNKEDVDTYNTLVITCAICKNASKEKLKKPEQINKDPIEEMAIEGSGKARKKKKKKDRFSGLDKSAVLSATPQNKNKINNNNFTPLEITTPVVTKLEITTGRKKKLFQQNNKRDSEIANRKRKEIKEKEKQKQLKGLNNILNNSKPSKSPSNALKLFLTSL